MNDDESRKYTIVPAQPGVKVHVVAWADDEKPRTDPVLAWRIDCESPNRVWPIGPSVCLAFDRLGWHWLLEFADGTLHHEDCEFGSVAEWLEYARECLAKEATEQKANRAKRDAEKAEAAERDRVSLSKVVIGARLKFATDRGVQKAREATDGLSEAQILALPAARLHALKRKLNGTPGATIQ